MVSKRPRTAVEELSGAGPCNTRTVREVQKPSPASLRIIRYPTGMRMLLLTSTAGTLPSPWVTAFLLEMILKPRAVRTVRNIAQGVHLGLEFADAVGIDIVERCAGEYLGDDELVRLAEHMRGGGEPRATAGTHYGATVAFMVFVGRRLCKRGDAEARGRLADWQESASRFRPTTLDRVPNPRFGLTSEQRDRFVEVIMPANPLNPFESTAYRNFVIFSLAFFCGLRSGELLGIKLDDLRLDHDPVQLIIARRPNDPHDTRPLPAMAKTRGRSLPLSPELATALMQLMEERAEVPAAGKHPYLLVNQDGGPLGEGGLRAIYQKLRAAVPELTGLINHMLRHDWSDRWNEMVEENGWNLDACLRMQCEAMGWTVGSTMPAHYGRRSIQRQASKRILELQRRGLRRNGKGT